MAKLSLPKTETPSKIQRSKERPYTAEQLKEFINTYAIPFNPKPETPDPELLYSVACALMDHFLTGDDLRKNLGTFKPKKRGRPSEWEAIVWQCQEVGMRYSLNFISKAKALNEVMMIGQNHGLSADDTGAKRIFPKIASLGYENARILAWLANTPGVGPINNKELADIVKRFNEVESKRKVKGENRT